MSASKHKKSTAGRVVGVIVLALLVAGIIRLFVFASFRMPSGQMESSILAGDFIGVNQLAYGIKYPDINGKTLSDCYYCHRPAHRNDVILYRHEGQVLIGRCVGIPGDTIEVKGFDYFINGKRFPKSPDTILPYQYRQEYDSIVVELMNRMELELRDSITGQEYKVRYLNRYEHYSLTDALPDSISLQAYEKGQKDYRITIPKEQYWLLCDNIDASADSRHYGFIPHKNLIGKAVFVWFSKDPSQSWLKGYRFKRIFKRVS